MSEHEINCRYTRAKQSTTISKFKLFIWSPDIGVSGNFDFDKINISAATKSKQILVMDLGIDGGSTDANMDTVLVERAFILLIHLIEHNDGRFRAHYIKI